MKYQRQEAGVPTSAKSNRGASLLELLLAVALGAAMTTAIVQLFVVNSRSQATLAGQARMQESARMALDFLVRSARGAGYFGCAANGQIANGLNAGWEQLAELDATVAVEGFASVAEGGAQPRLPLRKAAGATAFKSHNRIDASRLRAGSDLAVFRRADVGSALATAMNRDTEPIIVADDDGRFDRDDFVLLSTCGQAALFRVSATARGSGQTTLARATGSGPFANRAGASLLTAGTPYGAVDGPEGATASQLLTEFYFVASSRISNNRGDPIWALWRKTSTAPPAELVQGIDELTLLFGVDTTAADGVDAPTRYLDVNELAALPTPRAVRTVRFAVTASSVDVVTADEQVLRQTFSRTVALRNS